MMMREQFGRAGLVRAVALAMLMGASACAPDPAEPMLLASGVTRAEGYETPSTTYIVANPTNIYSNHFVYGTDVTGTLERGEPVEALAKVEGYEWILVGREGVGIGYVPISMLSPSDLYIP